MNRIEVEIVKRALFIVAIVSLSGCTLGPRYKRPDSPLPGQFDQAKDEQAAPAAENALWSAFNDAALSALIARAQQENKSIAQAAARLNETRALRGLSLFSWFPTVTAGGSLNKTNYSNLDPLVPAGTTTTDTYNAGFDASWEIDVFGGTRQQNRAINSETNANAYLLDAARLSVSAEVAQAYFALRGAQQRLKIQTQNIENLKRTDRILVALLKEGRGDALQPAQNKALMLQLEAQVPNTEADIVRQEQRLAVLTAQPVNAVREVLSAGDDMPVLPVLQAIGTPEQWIKRRPDVSAAELKFAAANALVGATMADYFPKVNLTGSFGWTAQEFGDLGSSNAQRWSYGPSISWSFLNVGRVRQNVKAAESRADAAAAAYQEVVLLALEDTENALAQYRASNQSQQRLQEAVDQSRKARDLAQLRYENGASDFLTLLDAERTLLTVEDARVQAKTVQATSLALVYKALAGDFAGAAQ
ncbi:MAG: efflux transporter outer membrane subunit [Steroidobacteraceae bacterium]